MSGEKNGTILRIIIAILVLGVSFVLFDFYRYGTESRFFVVLKNTFVVETYESDVFSYLDSIQPKTLSLIETSDTDNAYIRDYVLEGENQENYTMMYSFFHFYDVVDGYEYREELVKNLEQDPKTLIHIYGQDQGDGMYTLYSAFTDQGYVEHDYFVIMDDEYGVKVFLTAVYEVNDETINFAETNYFEKMDSLHVDVYNTNFDILWDGYTFDS